METLTSSQKCFPSPSPHSLLFGRTEDSSEFFGGKATLIGREREGIVVVSDYHSQSSQSFQSVSTVLSEIVAQAITFFTKKRRTAARIKCQKKRSSLAKNFIW